MKTQLSKNIQLTDASHQSIASISDQTLKKETDSRNSTDDWRLLWISSSYQMLRLQKSLDVKNNILNVSYKVKYKILCQQNLSLNDSRLAIYITSAYLILCKAFLVCVFVCVAGHSFTNL